MIDDRPRPEERRPAQADADAEVAERPGRDADEAERDREVRQEPEGSLQLGLDAQRSQMGVVSRGDVRVRYQVPTRSPPPTAPPGELASERDARTLAGRWARARAGSLNRQRTAREHSTAASARQRRIKRFARPSSAANSQGQPCGTAHVAAADPVDRDVDDPAAGAFGPGNDDVRSEVAARKTTRAPRARHRRSAAARPCRTM